MKSVSPLRDMFAAFYSSVRQPSMKGAEFFLHPKRIDPGTCFVLFQRQGIRAKDLLLLENKIRSIAKRKRTAVRPFFHLPGALGRAQAASLRKHREMKGWSVGNQKYWNIWTEQQPFELPRGMSFEVGEYHPRSPTWSAYELLTKKVFKVSDQFFKDNVRLAADLNQKASIVVLNQGSTPVAVGCVGSKRNWGWLYGGLVHPKYRGKGLWRLLVGIRQNLSAQYGVENWGLMTENKRIAKKADSWIGVRYCTKEG